MLSKNLLRSAAAAGVLLLVLGGCGKDTKTASKPAGGQGAADASGNKVDVKEFAFSPKSTTVKAGTTVTWTFSDSAAHNVEPVGGSEPKKSPDEKSGGTYTYTFSKPGNFTYRCGIHNYMTGTVNVTA